MSVVNESMNASMMSSVKEKKQHYFDDELLNLDLERIRIFIGVLEEHEENCEREERFPEAATTRDKIKLLRDVEEFKIFNDLNKYHSQQVGKHLINIFPNLIALTQ